MDEDLRTVPDEEEDERAATRAAFLVGCVTGAGGLAVLVLIGLAALVAPALRGGLAPDVPFLTRVFVSPLFAWLAPVLLVLGVLRVHASRSPLARRIVGVLVGVLSVATLVAAVLAYVLPFIPAA